MNNKGNHTKDEAAKICSLCQGKGEILCKACRGGDDDPDGLCYLCNGTGHVVCPQCGGKGTIQ
jgi:DnaJ-class molecular chaperone